MRCDDYIDRLYTLDELKDEYLKGRIETIHEFYKTYEKDKKEIYKKGFTDAIEGAMKIISKHKNSNRECTNGFFNMDNRKGIDYACIIISQDILDWAKTKV